MGNLDRQSIAIDFSDVQRVDPPVGAEGTRTRVQPGDILISITAELGMVGLVPSDIGEAYINQHVALARPIEELDPRYGAWFLASKHAQDQFEERRRGAVKAGLGLDDIRSVRIPLPPLPEQRRIVARIEELFSRLDAGVAALRHAKAQLQRYRQSVLAAAASGRLIGKQDHVTGAPVGWVEKAFGEVVINVSINDKKLPRKHYAETGKFPVVDQGREFIGGYSDDESRVVSEGMPLLIFGDHTRIFKFLDRRFVPGADGVKVLKPNGVDPKWLYYVSQALDFPDKGYARHFAHLKKARLLVPPTAEQHQIVAEVEARTTAIDHLEAELDRQITRSNRLRQSTLASAFSGQL
ncbi:MAG: restriction endonuclease subunit S [Akkermansiaceae bacterium]|nr:restriction endonuclease subunit S [Akkermansiaceae bacterium]